MTTTTTDTPTAFEKSTLDNGLRIVTSEMPHTRSVSISIFVGVGSRYESEDEAGISHFIEHLVFKGTERRPDPIQISGAIESTGGIINAGTEQEMTVYWCKVAEPHFQDALDLLIDMLRNPLLEEESTERERMVVIDELSMINDYPNYRVDTLIDEMLWPDHPLGRDIGGSKESIAGISRDMVRGHMERYYTPTNTVVSVAGNISHQGVVQQLEELTEGWQSGDPSECAPVTHVQSESQMRLEYKKTEQAHLSIALPGLSQVHPEKHALDLLSVILGEGMSSRLFVEVREKRGLAYDVHSGVAHFQDCGAFVVSAGTDPKRIYDAVETILAEIGAMRDSVPEEELEKAKRLVAGRMLLRMEDTRAVSGWYGNQEALLGNIMDMDEVVEQVNAITTDEIQKVANDLLVTDRLNMAVVGPCRGQRKLERLLKL